VNDMENDRPYTVNGRKVKDKKTALKLVSRGLEDKETKSKRLSSNRTKRKALKALQSAAKKAVPILGIGLAVGEVRKIHKGMKQDDEKRYGSKSLLSVIKK